MKRSILFWPLVFGAAVFLLWVVFCFFVIGVPSPAASRRAGCTLSWSLADRVLSESGYAKLMWLLVGSVNDLWRVAPYCRVPKWDPDWDRFPGALEICIWLWSPRQGGRLHMVGVGPLAAQGTYSDTSFPCPVVPLSSGEVLTYVVVIPGVHFALVVFLLALVVSAATRLLFKAIGLPEDASGENGKE